MTTLTARIPTAQLDNLDLIGSPTSAQATASAPPPQTASSGTTSSQTERILDAYEVARAYAEQIKDPEFKKNVEDKLVRSNVRGSLVVGVRGADDVAEMLSKVTDWKEVTANLKDKEITVLQGTLPENYSAFAAYASVREIAQKFAAAGLGTIQAKAGYQHEGDYYFCTMLRFPTDVLTVQIKKDAGVEHLHQWFAGPEISSRLHFNDGDTIVRCGVVIPLASEQNQKKGNRNDSRKNNRANRAG